MISREDPVSDTLAWPVLDARECRVLGVLIEKAKTTPDAYPMSINGLVAGCNQKSNRDPLMNLNDLDVEDTLARLQKKGLVMRITGTRVERWRHELYEVWKIDKIDVAILGELLLRGPQTEGELRSRVSRMESFDDLDALRAALQPLAERKLVIYLTPQGKRGTALTHGFHPPAEMEFAKKRFSGTEDAASPSPPPVAAPVPVSVSPNVEQRLTQLEQAVERLTQELAELRKRWEG
jgi:uncharacterized protein